MKVMGGALNLGPGQGKDFANSLGPCIGTSDEIGDPYKLLMRAYINGEQVSEGASSGMHYKFEDLIAHITRGHGVGAGEIFCSGTVAGGCCLETGRTLVDGDIIELEIEKIGRLRNRVLAPHILPGGDTSTQSVFGALTRLGNKASQ